MRVSPRLASLLLMSERGQRLCLLLEAGPARFAIAASSVLEVAVPDAGGATLRGHHPLVDLSARLAGPDRPDPSPLPSLCPCPATSSPRSRPS